MTLIAVEIRRLLSRRLVKWLTILMILGFALAAVIVFINSNGTYRFADIADVLTALSFPLISFGLLLGSSGIGAEWAHRTMTASLTWEPRRGHLLASKYAAITVTTFLWSTFLLVVLMLFLWLVATWRGSTAGVDADMLAEAAEALVRVGVMASVGSLMGAGLAMIGHNTAAALGIAFGYILVIENLVRAFKPEWSDLLFGDNASLFILGAEDMGVIGHSQALAGLILLGYAAACALAGWVAFRNREVA